MHLIEVMDLNDDTFTKYNMNITFLNSSNNMDEDINQIENRVFNRCYCSYSNVSNISIDILPKWIERCFVENNININTSSSFYNIIFRWWLLFSSNIK